MSVRIRLLSLTFVLGTLLVSPMASLAQTRADSVVQGAPVVVEETVASERGPGETLIALDPETDAPSSVWDRLGGEVPDFHAFESGSGGYGSLFAARGLSNTPYFSDPAVTVYLDAIPLPSSFTYPEGILGFQSAAVFLGPRGSEFGRATDGGVVILGPADDPIARSEAIATGGSFDLRQAAMDVATGPVGPVDVTVLADYDARDGYIRNTRLGINVDDVENETAFGRARFRPKPGDEFTIEWLRARSRDGAQPLVPLGGPLYDVSRAMEGVTDLDSLGIAAKGTFSLPGSASLTTDTSYTDWRMNPYQSFLILPPPLANEVVQDQKHWNEEIRYAGDPKATVRVAAGAWLSKGTTQNFTERVIPGLFPVDGSSFTQSDASLAAFANVSVDPAPHWTLEAGLRAEADTKDFARLEYIPTPGLTFDGSGRYDAVLPMVQSRWSLVPGTSLEVSASTGLRPGGFASFTDNPALMPFAAERTTAFSLGGETALDQGAVTASVTFFYDAVTDFQIERSFTPADYLVATAPRAHTEGAEFSAHWRLTGAWSVAASAGWTRAVLDSFVAPITGQDESGNPAPNVPAYNSGLRLSYQPARGWFASGQLAAVGAAHFDERESPKYTQAPYALLGLATGYQAQRWSLSIFGENLGKAGYYALIIPGVNSGEPGAPRTVGAKAALRF